MPTRLHPVAPTSAGAQFAQKTDIPPIAKGPHHEASSESFIALLSLPESGGSDSGARKLTDLRSDLSTLREYLSNLDLSQDQIEQAMNRLAAAFFKADIGHLKKTPDQDKEKKPFVGIQNDALQLYEEYFSRLTPGSRQADAMINLLDCHGHISFDENHMKDPQRNLAKLVGKLCELMHPYARLIVLPKLMDTTCSSNKGSYVMVSPDSSSYQRKKYVAGPGVHAPSKAQRITRAVANPVKKGSFAGLAFFGLTSPVFFAADRANAWAKERGHNQTRNKFQEVVKQELKHARKYQGEIAQPLQAEIKTAFKRLAAEIGQNDKDGKPMSKYYHSNLAKLDPNNWKWTTQSTGETGSYSQ